MQRAQYPAKTCRDPLFNDHGMGYACELPDLHPGPHATFSIADSVMRRNAWEMAHEGWEKDIGRDPDDIDAQGKQKEQE